jgi:hypothetical protein
MERLSQKVSDAVIACKKAFLVPFYSFIQSTSGHNFARKAGPVIQVLILLSQAVHAFFLFKIFGPEYRRQYKDYEPLPSLFILLGWWLCYKVTYLYYRVSSAPLANPKAFF